MSSNKTNVVRSTREVTESGTTEVTYYGYWWGPEARYSCRTSPSSISPLFGHAPPNGRATLTIEYDTRPDQETDGSETAPEQQSKAGYPILSVRASYTHNEGSENESTSYKTMKGDEDDVSMAILTTVGTGRVGAVERQSRPLIFLQGVQPSAESTLIDKDSGWKRYAVDKADVYVEVLADWGCNVGSAGEFRYRLKASPRRD